MVYLRVTYFKEKKQLSFAAMEALINTFFSFKWNFHCFIRNFIKTCGFIICDSSSYARNILCNYQGIHYASKQHSLVAEETKYALYFTVDPRSYFFFFFVCFLFILLRRIGHAYSLLLLLFFLHFIFNVRAPSDLIYDNLFPLSHIIPCRCPFYSPL